MSELARPLNELAKSEVASAPTPGKGLSLDIGGGIPDTVTGMFLPWIVDVNVYMSAISNTTFATTTIHAAASSVYNAAKESTGVQNSEINFDIVLAAGTWTFELMHVADNNRGIYTVSLGDGTNQTTLGTVDGYKAALSYNNLGTITGIVIAATAKQRLRLKMATKNGASASYFGSMQHIQFRRTA